MPMQCSLSESGRFIHGIVSGRATGEELAEYEATHVEHARPGDVVLELLEVSRGALDGLTPDDIAVALESRSKSPDAGVPHRCAIVVDPEDAAGQRLAVLYQQMARRHFPEAVVVFGDVRTACDWLGVPCPAGRSSAA